MAMQSSSNKNVPLWAKALQLIPTAVWILVVVLLLVYKPEGYKAIVIGFIFAFVLVAGLATLATRKARARKLKNG